MNGGRRTSDFCGNHATASGLVHDGVAGSSQNLNSKTGQSQIWPKGSSLLMIQSG